MNAAEERDFYAAARAPGQLCLVGARGYYREGLFSLSPAETEILEAMAEGLSTREIAEVRGTSFFTVQAQRRTLQAKLGAANPAQAVAEGFRQGYLS